VRPHLLEIPLFGWSLNLPTYGVLLAAAFLAALWFSIREARRAGIPKDPIMDLWILSLVSGIVGAKLLLYLLDLEYYIENPRAILSGLRSAGVFYGGLVAALAACAIMVRRRGLPGWKIADIAAPAIALAQSIGRIGCFAAGCCYGNPTDLPWAVTFTSYEAHEITGVPLDAALHPSQIYLSLSNLLLFPVLLWIGHRKRYDGQVFLWYVVLYGILRGALEITRGDPRGEVAGYSTSQIIAAIAVLGAVILMAYRRRRGPSPPRSS
jgi:phosphatidylglycerol:prolipoprotein diacylglycerol transferase